MITRIAFAAAAAILGFGLTACGSDEPVAIDINMDDPASMQAMNDAKDAKCDGLSSSDAISDCRDDFALGKVIAMHGTVLQAEAIGDDRRAFFLTNDNLPPSTKMTGQLFICYEDTKGCADVKEDDTVYAVGKYESVQPKGMSVMVIPIVQTLE